jgi:hypothetical protein
MFINLLRGSVGGGIILFLWGALSWTLLPWHTATFEKFVDEEMVAIVLGSNANDSGVYLLPNLHPQDTDATSPEQQSKAEADAKQRMKLGPFVFASIKLDGADPEMGAALWQTFAVDLIAALLATWLLAWTSGLGYWQRVLFVTAIGVTGGIIGHAPNWIWWQFPTGYTAAAMADALLAWFLAGLVIARWVGLGRVIQLDTGVMLSSRR